MWLIFSAFRPSVYVGAQYVDDVVRNTSQ